MKILFSTNQLNYRGTTVAIRDYARYNQIYLGNESVIHYKNSFDHKDIVVASNEVVVKHLRDEHNVIHNSDIHEVIKKEKPDLVYQLTSGELTEAYHDIDCKTKNHAVFQFDGGHIDAYISKWLSNECSNNTKPFVPHIVELPTPTCDYREHLGIPESAFVFGRYGGYDTFDIDFVKELIDDMKSNKEFYFLFVGTKPFKTDNENVRFLRTIYNENKKSNFINTCDAMLHARSRGESFGLAICEFLFHNKPVFAWNGGVDKNHIELLKKCDTLYENKEDLKMKITSLDFIQSKDDLKSIVDEFSPNLVMKKFKEVFIDG